MRIAIVLTTRWWRASIDQDGYGAALKRSGHDPVLYCHGNDAGTADFPVIEASAEEMNTSAYWKKQSVDIAIVFNWLKEPQLLQALQSAGIKTITRADSDGLSSVRVFPGSTRETAVSSARNTVEIYRQNKHWIKRYFFLGEAEDRELIATVAASNAVAIESQAAADNLVKVLKHYNRQDLTSRVKVVPHSVSDPFLTAPIGPTARRPQIFCGGRWNDTQKGAPLLAATIERLLAKRDDLEFIIAGPGLKEAFPTLINRKGVQLAGLIDRKQIPQILAESRFLLASSRWETQPIGTLEALCVGATVVAPALPGFLELADGGASGTLSEKRTPAGLAKAAQTELEQWDRELRDPVRIATLWRAKVSNEAVMRGLLATVA